jgi:transcriptional regulator with XRE-family HTH domain
MFIGQKLRQIRESKNLSQGDLEQRTGLFCSYTSRVENGHTVPSIATLEKYARALEVPLYQLFHDGESPINKPEFALAGSGGDLWGRSGKERRELRLLTNALSRMNERDRKLFFKLAKAFAKKRGKN